MLNKKSELKMDENLDRSSTAIIYTDGSCNTQSLTGAWVAIIFVGDYKQTLSGLEYNTTHNRMELQAVIKAIEFVQDRYKGISSLTINTDSQYVAGLQSRKQRLLSLNFASKTGRPLQNTDLVKKLLALFEIFAVETIKIKAHQRINDLNEFNIEADLLARKMVREASKE